MRKFLFILLVMAANFAAAQTPDSIYITKDTVSQNVLIYDAGNDNLLETFAPAKDLRWGGTSWVYIMTEGRMLYGIKPENVTKTVIGTTETPFSGTAQQLIALLQLSFFKP